MAADNTSFEDLGPNSGLIEEMYRRYVENPGSVAETWREFFADYRPLGTTDGNGSTPPEPAAPATPAAPKPSAIPALPEPPAPTAPATSGDEPEPLRGAAARTVVNMEASLGVPTATSVRTIPARLLEVNRQILNNQLARSGGGKVSFTHLIAFAVVRAVGRMPALNAGFAVVDGKPAVVHHEHMNLGLAVDVKKSDDSRTLLVPTVKAADTLDFAGFFRAYEELIRKVRTNKLSPDDFAGTTGTITNPGMIGTVHSVPRLMPGQGFIIGAGSIGYPAEYQGADPQLLARIGVGKVITLTNTYDHRIIGGAESGEFLRWIHHLLLGEDGFYDDVFQSLAVPYEPARWSTDTGALDDDVVKAEKVVHVHQLINMYRVRGHLIANLDPLGRREPRTHPELDIRHYGLTIWDLEREFPVGSLGVDTIDERVLPLRDILGVLRDAYARSVGVEYMHIQDPDQKDWLQRHVEGATPAVSPDDQRRILDRLNAAEAFEAFLQRKYLGEKRFSLEGAESLIPMLDALLNVAADDGVNEAVLGMAHRGRLNVLVNTIGQGYGQIFREFEGALDPASVQGSGDVKYHVGAIGKHRAPSGAQLTITMASNPSHLEAVDPVVEGMARAATDAIHDDEADTVLPVLVHGDAAFAGQGVVAETFNLSAVPGYEVGGTVHVVVNNQLGFTTSPSQGRSGVYATDVAKMVQAPIFHVNGDDPEACVRVIRLAYEF
ncbi:MAG: multifunctional oxoglutarate decarboxylase/oxoglutarate dehydrogenase thiamine pyrophosphate-binding subunit/dihydrolipoyllysine-residue succinyltransferase subunit, partial [Acidimicrobiia bacterium]